MRIVRKKVFFSRLVFSTCALMPTRCEGKIATNQFHHTNAVADASTADSTVMMSATLAHNAHIDLQVYPDKPC